MKRKTVCDLEIAVLMSQNYPLDRDNLVTPHSLTTKEVAPTYLTLPILPIKHDSID
jgi:hypothetical protein